MKELLCEQIIKKNGCMTVYKRWYRGEICGATIIDGFTGKESVLIENELRPAHAVFVKPPSQLKRGGG